MAFFRTLAASIYGLGPRYRGTAAIIVVALPISMIVMGCIYRDDCPAERHIPIYLIVSGCFSIFFIALLVTEAFMKDDTMRKQTIQGISGLVSLFVVTWFIVGNVWIYGIYNKYEPDNALAQNYCLPTLYLFAFWVTNVAYIVIGIILLALAIYACYEGGVLTAFKDTVF